MGDYCRATIAYDQAEMLEKKAEKGERGGAEASETGVCAQCQIKGTKCRGRISE